MKKILAITVFLFGILVTVTFTSVFMGCDHSGNTKGNGIDDPTDEPGEKDPNEKPQEQPKFPIDGLSEADARADLAGEMREYLDGLMELGVYFNSWGATYKTLHDSNPGGLLTDTDKKTLMGASGVFGHLGYNMMFWNNHFNGQGVDNVFLAVGDGDFCDLRNRLSGVKRWLDEDDTLVMESMRTLQTASRARGWQRAGQTDMDAKLAEQLQTLADLGVEITGENTDEIIDALKNNVLSQLIPKLLEHRMDEALDKYIMVESLLGKANAYDKIGYNIVGTKASEAVTISMSQPMPETVIPTREDLGICV